MEPPLTRSVTREEMQSYIASDGPGIQILKSFRVTLKQLNVASVRLEASASVGESQRDDFY